MASVEFRGVSKYFDELCVLDNLSLAVSSGEFVSLLGPSGSGKTTTLNLLAGLLAADAGEICIADTVVNSVAPNHRNIAMVFQSYALYPHMTVFENIAFPLRARRPRLSEARVTDKVGDVAAILGIGELLARYPRELSGGQQQRVALGRSMVRDPKVFLLDEPLSNLDARLRIRMRRDIKALHETIGSTIVYVTHDQAEAMTLSDRVAVFNQGRLQQFGAPTEIYDQPVNTFVANFIGEREINFLTGELSPDALTLADGTSVPLPPNPYARSLAGRKVVLGVRSEDVVHVSGESDGGFPAVVTLAETVRPSLVVYAKLAGGTELCSLADPSLQIAKGQVIRLRFRPEHLFFFDPGSGNRITA